MKSTAESGTGLGATELVGVSTRGGASFTADEHDKVEATWGIYERMIAAYREPNRT